MKTYIYTFLLLLMPFMVSAAPEIVKIDIVHATCPLNGEIEITIANAVGQVQYELERINAPVGEHNFTKGPHTLNYFTDLPPGEYVVKVYDASTGSTPVTRGGIIIQKKYDKEFAMNIPTLSYGTGAANNQYCEDNGIITASGSGGSRPYYCKIVNTTTNQVYEKTGTASGTSIQFTKLPDGDYTVEMRDACGTGSLYNGKLKVQGSGTALNHIKLTSFVFNPTNNVIFRLRYSNNCSELYLQTFYTSYTVSGTNLQTNTNVTSINSTYSARIEYRLEYPLGTYGDWGVANTYRYYYNQIKDYDPTIDQYYRIQVRNPCRPDEILTSEAYTIPKVKYSFTANYIGPVYSDYCNIPNIGGFRLNLSTSGGVYDYICSNNFKITVVSEDNLYSKDFYWQNTNSYINIENIPLGKRYFVTVRDNVTNSILTATPITINLTNIPSKPLGLKSAAIRMYEQGYNYGRECDFETHAIYPYITTSSTYLDGFTNSYYHTINLSNKITYSIVEAPAGVSRSPLERTGSQLLWTDLPAGNYKIKVDYGCRSDILETVIKPVVTGFDAKEPVIGTTGICGNNSISVQGYFLDSNGNPYSNSALDYSYYMQVFDSENKSYTSLRAGSNATATVSGLPAGTYTVKFYAYRSLSGANRCYYPKEFTVEIPDYYPPSIDIAFSGGISCTPGGKANLTVSATGSNQPFQYRYKVKDADDSTYSPWQTSNVFPQVNPGHYTIQVWNTCFAYKTQDLTVYSSGDQFVGLLGYVGDVQDGAICESKPARITVLSIGPVNSYQWYKDGQLLVGETGPEYLIPSASTADIGEYKVVIDNGACNDLTSSVNIVKVLPPAEKPTLSADECLYEGTPIKLTATTTVQNPSFQWYLNDEIISGASGSTYNAIKAGVYTVTVTPPNACPSDPSNAVIISLPELYWDNTKQSNNWNDVKNWLRPDGTAANTLPCGKTAVIIPGSAQTTNVTYPSLDVANTPVDKVGMPVCRQITFQYGAEIAHPHRLVYDKALVQYNWGYYNNNNNFSGVPDNKDADQNIYGASAPKMSRDKWYALSAPLKKMASGDFGLAGYPLTWQAKFQAKNTTGIGLTDCDFSVPFASNDVNLANDKNYNAIAIKVASYSNTLGRKDQKYLESLQGIIEIPYFENIQIAPYYPNHLYDPYVGESKFYYFNTQNLKQLHSPIGRMQRKEEAYRFIFEDDNTNSILKHTVKGEANIPAYAITVTRQPNESRMVMIGNPFVSSINSENFYEANSSVLAPKAQGYYTFNAANQTWKQNAYASGNYIAPLQAFVITLDEHQTSATLLFPLEGNYALTGATNRAAPMSLPLGRSLFVKSGNGETESDYAVLSVNENGNYDLDVSKIIFPESHTVPETFFISPETKKSNLIQSYKPGVREVGLGVKTSDKTNNLNITFENVEEFAAANNVLPILVDKFLGVEQSLLEDNVYYFKQTRATESNKYTDAERFTLRLLPLDGSEDINDGSIVIEYSQNQLTVKAQQNVSTVTVYDVQGKMIHAESQLNSTKYTRQLGLKQGVYVVKVVTHSGETKTKKIVTHKEK